MDLLILLIKYSLHQFSPPGIINWNKYKPLLKQFVLIQYRGVGK
jgi:hypothetical protein